MRGNMRRKNRAQSQKDVVFKQDRFGGGWVNDLPATDLPKDTLALLQNFNAYPEYLEGRSGSQLYSSTTLPGSGTVHSIAQHPVSQKWLLHRGTALWTAAAAMSSWTEVKRYGIGGFPLSQATIGNDTLSQFGDFVIRGTNDSNSNAGTHYWVITHSGSTRILTIYKDSARTQSVASGSKLNDGRIYLTPLNGSGISGHAYITFSADSSSASNTLSQTYNLSFGVNSASTIKPFNNDFVVAVVNSIVSTTRPVIVKMSADKFYNLNSQGNYLPAVGFGFGPSPFLDSGTQSSATPYGYRVIYTYCRIVDSSGNASFSDNRVTATLEKESPGNNFINKAGTDFQTDYGEFWAANPLDATNPLVVYTTTDGTGGAATTDKLFALSADEHWTHIGIYRTMDIGSGGVDPVTGSGNNRELYIWCGDFPIYSVSVSLSKDDDILRSLYTAGFGLRTRGWRDIPPGEVLEIAPNFLYLASRNDHKVYYGQLSDKDLVGYYQPAFQYFKLNDAIQIIAKSPDMVSFICSNSTYISSPTSYINAGGAAFGTIYVLQHLTTASVSIGCTDYGSIAEIDSANNLGDFGAGGYTGFIARCSDNTIRVWNSSSWSSDLSSRRINKIIQSMTVGSVGAYWKGTYRLYYRTSTGSSNTTSCVRLGMSSDSGSGWSLESGSALPLPPTYAGAGHFVDANGEQRMFCIDAADSQFYWIETFTSSALTKVFLDKVAVNGSGGTAITCTALFREITAPEEDQTLIHREAHIFARPYSESTGLPNGFSINYSAFLDGSTTAASTLTGVANKADLQFFDTVSGNRIQPQVQFARSGARLTGFNALFDAQDKAEIGNGPSAYTDAANQAALAQNMKIWLSRPQNLLNRASGSSFTLTGTAPTNVTGPDGKTYGLSFVSGASYSLAETTSYTDFTLHFWVKTPTTVSRLVQITGANSFYVQFTSNTSLSINGAGNLTCATVASGWHDFWIVRSGSTVTAYQNGAALSGTVSVSTARGGTTFNINSDAAAMLLYDIRAYNTVLSAADIAYYYAAVTTTNGGVKVLPLG